MLSIKIEIQTIKKRKRKIYSLYVILKESINCLVLEFQSTINYWNESKNLVI